MVAQASLPVNVDVSCHSQPCPQLDWGLIGNPVLSPSTALLRGSETTVAISGVSDDFQTSLVVQLKLAKVSEILTLRSE